MRIGKLRGGKKFYVRKRNLYLIYVLCKEFDGENMISVRDKLSKLLFLA